MQQVSDVIYCGRFDRVVGIGGGKGERVAVRLIKARDTYLFSVRNAIAEAPDLRERLINAMRHERCEDDLSQAEIRHGFP